MLRFVLLLLVGLSFAGSAQAGFLDDLKAKAAANREKMIKEGRMPPVQLNQKQLALLPKATRYESKTTWVGAGRQKDGKIFVCHVSNGKLLFGGKHVGVFAGTFEKDGSYQRTSTHMHSAFAVIQECWMHGLRPPVWIKGQMSF